MIKRIGLLLLSIPLFGLPIADFGPSAREAAAQNSDRRRDEGDEGGGRGEWRRGERGRFGGGEGGRRGFMRRGGGEGDSERGARGSENRENQGNDRLQRSNDQDGSSDRRSGGSGSNLNMDEYVKRLVQERDKDGDMMLKGDEISGLSGRAATADGNKDGVITTDELKSALTGNGPANGSAAAATAGSESNEPSDGNSENGERGGRGDRRRGRDRLGETGERARSGGGGASALTPLRVYTALTAGGKDAKSTDEKEQQRTYRFSRGADRLPATGLPSWFKSRDNNGDGQVEMSEYSRTWSDRTVAEFRRYDLNNDGVVTAKEAAGK